MSSFTLIDSQAIDHINVDNRGLAYGDGVFETMKVANNTIELFDLHLERLQHGCERLAIGVDIEALRADIALLLSANDARLGVIKVIITRRSTGRGYKAALNLKGHRIVSIEPLVSSYSYEQERGVALRLCGTRLGINPRLAGIKHLARLENVIARSEWDDPSIAEGLMLDTDGRLIEGTMSNIFLVKQGVLYTPDLQRCGVEGVVRRYIMESVAPSLDLHIKVKDLSLDDVYQSEELFICNSLIGVLPVIALGCHLKSVGVVSKQVQLGFAQGVQHSV